MPPRATLWPDYDRVRIIHTLLDMAEIQGVLLMMRVPLV
jgi:hypothetical protein